MGKSVLRRVMSFGLSAVIVAGSTVFPQFGQTAAQAADAGIQDFSIGDVTMLDEYSVNAFNKEVEYLLSFDTNKLLAGFRQNAGLNTYGATRYGGWESTNIAGHTVGHYMTAIAQAYQNPSLTDNQRSEL